jgi:hypothetical protein
MIKSIKMMEALSLFLLMMIQKMIITILLNSKVDKLRPQSSLFSYDQIYKDDGSIKLVFADDDPTDDSNDYVDKCKVDKLRP